MTKIEKVVARALVGAALYDRPAPDGATVFLDILRGAGFVVVPREPTKAMLEGARDWSLKKNGLGVGNDQASGCYHAMIAAAEGKDG